MDICVNDTGQVLHISSHASYLSNKFRENTHAYSQQAVFATATAACYVSGGHSDHSGAVLVNVCIISES